MHIVFVQKWKYEQPGIASISALLKKHGHRVEVIVDCLEKDVVSEVRAASPDVIFFSVTTPEEDWVFSLSVSIKNQSNIPVVVGGMHATIFPEIIMHPGVDILCRGEGEYAALDLLQAMQNNEPYHGIANLWVKQNGNIHKNAVRPLIQNLDNLPFPDHSIYDKYVAIRDFPWAGFILTRGCHFGCSFCYSHRLREFYKHEPGFVRRKSVDYAIQEIATYVSRYKITSIHFYDSVFGIDIEWAIDFLNKYGRKIGISFTCNIRPEIATEEYLSALQRAGCRGVTIGIETGNERLRNDILKKNMSNSSLIRTALLLKKYGIELLTENMFGLPGETYQDAISTVILNKRMHAKYVLSNLLQPFPNLQVTDYCRKRGILNEGKPTFYSKSLSLIKNPELDKILPIHYLLYYLVKIPFMLQLLRPLLPYFPIRWLQPLKLYNQINFLRFYRIPITKVIENHKLRMSE